jgi:16S rRNA (uracil1498-N3)-methyltransferase
MRLSRVFINSPFEINSPVLLPKESAHYLHNVLRLRVEDSLLVFNQTQGEFLALVTKSSKKEFEVQLLEPQRLLSAENQQNSISIHLVLGLSRGDRMDFALQKSTELGVSEITPVYTEHGEVKLKADRVEKKLQHWRNIAISAAEQSGRLTIPVIHQPIALSALDLANENTYKVLLEPTGSDVLPQSIATKNIELLIGPEGGFSISEIAWAKKNGCEIVALGARILRTETAPIAALAILQHKFGDMGTR